MHEKYRVYHQKYGNRRKRKFNYKRLLLSLTFLCIITLMPLAYSSFFTINNIIVRGNRNISTKEIIATIDSYYNKNLLAVKPVEVKQAIQATIPVEDVNVSYKLPHTLIVEVKERDMAVALNYLNGFVLIDSEGIVVKMESKLETYSIPVVTGLNIVSAKVAGRPIFEENVSYFDDLLGLINILEPIMDELSEINITVNKSDDADFYLYTLDGFQVLLDDMDEDKVKRLKDLLDDLRGKGLGKGLLDIRHKEPIYKPFDSKLGEGSDKE